MASPSTNSPAGAGWLAAVGYWLFFEAVWLVVVPVLSRSETGSWVPAWRAPFVVAVGLTLVVAGSAAVVVAHRTLVVVGGGTPLPLRPPARLVTSGVYGVVRNPAGLGLVAMTVGAALAADVESVWLLPLVAGLWVVGILAPGEKVRLVEKFGDEYLEYRSAVPGWVPRLSGPAAR